MNLREMIELENDFYKKNNQSNPVFNLLLKHGTEWKGAFFKGKQGKKKECFSNALHLALVTGYQYAEGYALPDGLIHMQHAWCIDKNGNVVDPTWDDPEKATYLGIAMSAEDALDICLKKGYYGILAGPVTYYMDVIEELDKKLTERSKDNG